MINLGSDVVHQNHIAHIAIEDFSDSSVLQYFKKQMSNFADAVHFGPRSNIVPQRIEQVRNARTYLNVVYNEYKELPCGEIQRYISLKDVQQDGVTYTPCIITFLHDVSKEQMHDELNTLINNGSIKGVADGHLTTAFVRARLFETGKPVQNTIVIPKVFQKKSSAAKMFFRAVVLSRSVDGTKDDWRFLPPEEIKRGMSILVFR